VLLAEYVKQRVRLLNRRMDEPAHLIVTADALNIHPEMCSPAAVDQARRIITADAALDRSAGTDRGRLPLRVAVGGGGH
jgi:hypothetical protein